MAAAPAASTVAEVAVPPLVFVTANAAAAVAAPKVQDTVMVVVVDNVAAPHVPSAVAATLTPAEKPVPVRVKEVVELAVAVAGVTAEMTGAG